MSTSPVFFATQQEDDSLQKSMSIDEYLKYFFGGMNYTRKKIAHVRRKIYIKFYHDIVSITKEERFYLELGLKPLQFSMTMLSLYYLF